MTDQQTSFRMEPAESQHASRRDVARRVSLPLGITQNALAMKIRVPATRIGDIVHGKRAITPDTALRLARFFGNSPEFWLNLQQMHDLSKARLELSKTIERDVEAYAGA